MVFRVKKQPWVYLECFFKGGCYFATKVNSHLSREDFTRLFFKRDFVIKGKCIMHFLTHTTTTTSADGEKKHINIHTHTNDKLVIELVSGGIGGGGKTV